MGLRNTHHSYGSVIKFLHWLIALLVIVLLCVGYLLGYIQDKAVFAKVVNVHKLVGLSVLVLMIIRLAWALINPKPELPNTPCWQRFIERVVHYSLYALLIAMPLTGWIMSVASGHTPKLFNWSLGLPIPESKTIGKTFFNMHTLLAIVIIVLVSLHVLAALYHHFIKKDDVLKRMM